jgi:hypothetical protein
MTSQQYLRLGSDFKVTDEENLYTRANQRTIQTGSALAPVPKSMSVKFRFLPLRRAQTTTGLSLGPKVQRSRTIKGGTIIDLF